MKNEVPSTAVVAGKPCHFKVLEHLATSGVYARRRNGSTQPDLCQIDVYSLPDEWFLIAH